MAGWFRKSNADNDWQKWWDARLLAMEAILGPSDDTVFHAKVPLAARSPEASAADVVSFSKKIPGIAYATAELIGCDHQRKGALGNYELLIVHRAPNDWGPGLISRLALYTFDAVLSHGETMDISPIVPEDSTLSALLFCEAARLEVLGRKAGLLLCMGITPDELSWKSRNGGAALADRLKQAGIYPYTDMQRASVLP